MHEHGGRDAVQHCIVGKVVRPEHMHMALHVVRCHAVGMATDGQR
jgi:hypothetical protein